MSTAGRPEGPPSRTVNLDIGNLAEVHMLSINPAHITHVRLTGAQRGDNRNLEISLTSGLSLGVNFDDPATAERVFQQVIAAMQHTIALH